jgi:lipopolysaccharide export system protein LptC
MAYWLRLVWDRLSLYLPVFLMAVLAFGTYWLVRSTPALFAPEVKKVVKHEPDYFMKNFAVRSFDANGRLKSEVFGEQARHYPDTDTLEIDQVRIRSFNDVGRLTTATAQRALTNGDASEVQLFGDATVVREPVTDANGAQVPRTEFRSEFLHAFMNTERVRTNKPVQLTRGDSHFTADAMEYDNLDRLLHLSGRVRVVAPGPQK